MNTKAIDFPEVKWKVKPLSIWVSTGFLAFLLSLCLGGMILSILQGHTFVQMIALFLFLGLCSLPFPFLLYTNWISNHKAELQLNGDGIYYTGWKRPILFQDVEAVAMMTFRGGNTLVFSLKRPQPSPLKFNLAPSYKSPVATISLNRFQAKPANIAETVRRYFIRQPATSDLCLPELVTVRLVTPSGTPFRCADVLVYVNVSARHKNSYRLGPYPTDSEGVASFDRQELEAEVSATQDTGLMDYGSIEDCYPKVEIILSTPEATSRALEARSKTWTRLLKGEEKRWKSIEELRALYRRAETATRGISVLDPVCIRDEWSKTIAKYDYIFHVQPRKNA